jgi:hypothetical protein
VCVGGGGKWVFAAPPTPFLQLIPVVIQQRRLLHWSPSSSMVQDKCTVLRDQVIEAVDPVLADRGEQVDGEEQVGGGDAAPPLGVQVVRHLAQQRGPASNRNKDDYKCRCCILANRKVERQVKVLIKNLAILFLCPSSFCLYHSKFRC